MEAAKTLRRPQNWQDFESLCKKLWGEIWRCPEIKKNGRLGQVQNGVDVYGIPKGETKYYGVQCKGKNEYSDKQFTEQELVAEIENAKRFTPPLKKLYFATTALKDAQIEAFVRQKNVEHLSTGLFEVHLFCWEDVVELIDENKHTHDWYLKNQNFRTRKEVKVTFSDDTAELNSAAAFRKVIINHRQKILHANQSDSLFSYMGGLDTIAGFSAHRLGNFESNVNLSYFRFQIKVQNIGSEPIENYKIIVDIEGDIQDVSDTNESGGLAFMQHSNVDADPQGRKATINPEKAILVGDDVFISDTIFIKPRLNARRLTLKWKLVSKDYKESGELYINVQTYIETDSQIVLVEHPFQAGMEDGTIEDLIIPKSEIDENP
jgi:hypothetical protein